MAGQTSLIVLAYAVFALQAQEPQTLNTSGLALQQQGRYAEAERAFRQGLQICDRPRNPCEALPGLLNSMGNLLGLLGRTAEATPLLDRALALAPDASARAKILNNLATLYRQTGDYARSERTANVALDEESHAPEPSVRASILSTLGAALLTQGRVEQAGTAFEESAQLRARDGGSVDLADVWNNLGVVYKAEHRLEEAARMHQRALKLLPADATMRPSVLHNLGVLRAEQGRIKDAAKLLRQAVEGWEQRLGPEHPNVAAGLSSLASLWIEQKHFDDAKPLLDRAWAIDTQHFPAGHIRIGFDLNNQAALAAGLKHHAEAEGLLLRAEPVFEHALPAHHPETGKLWQNLARVAESQGHFEDAEVRFARAVAILTDAWGPQDPRLIPLLEDYSRVLRVRENFAEAARQDMLAMRIRVYQARQKRGG